MIRLYLYDPILMALLLVKSTITSHNVCPIYDLISTPQYRKRGIIISTL